MHNQAAFLHSSFSWLSVSHQVALCITAAWPGPFVGYCCCCCCGCRRSRCGIFLSFSSAAAAATAFYHRLFSLINCSCWWCSAVLLLPLLQLICVWSRHQAQERMHTVQCPAPVPVISFFFLISLFLLLSLLCIVAVCDDRKTDTPKCDVSGRELDVWKPRTRTKL